MNAISTSILILLVAMVLVTPRRWAILGMVAGVLYLTQWTSVDVGGFNLFPVRFLEMAGFIRVMARREFSFSRLNEIDRLFLVFYGYFTLIFLLRANGGFAYAVGLAVDASLCYFTFRGLIGDIDDFRWFLCAFVILLVPYVALLFMEMHSGHTPLSILGGPIPADWLRNGRVRCIGSFREPSLLGSLGASFLPLYIGLSFSKTDRLRATAGIFLCLAIVWFSNSGGPLGFTCFVVLGWILWFYRDRMSLVRRVGLAGIVVLAQVMKAPIWYLPTHFSFGGDAWHRSYLIDVSMRHLSEWWFWGMSTSKTAQWFANDIQLGAGDQADITNQFISFGLSAGLMAIVLFIWVLVRAFRSLGKKLAEVRLASVRPSETEYLLWGLGAMLFGHFANFFSITYFDQIYVIWFMQLAIISTLTHEDGPVYVPAISTRFQPLNLERVTSMFCKH